MPGPSAGSSSSKLSKRPSQQKRKARAKAEESKNQRKAPPQDPLPEIETPPLELLHTSTEMLNQSANDRRLAFVFCDWDHNVEFTPLWDSMGDMQDRQLTTVYNCLVRPVSQHEAAELKTASEHRKKHISALHLCVVSGFCAIEFQPFKLSHTTEHITHTLKAIAVCLAASLSTTVQDIYNQWRPNSTIRFTNAEKLPIHRRFDILQQSMTRAYLAGDTTLEDFYAVISGLPDNEKKDRSRQAMPLQYLLLSALNRSTLAHIEDLPQFLISSTLEGAKLYNAVQQDQEEGARGILAQHREDAAVMAVHWPDSAIPPSDPTKLAAPSYDMALYRPCVDQSRHPSTTTDAKLFRFRCVHEGLAFAISLFQSRAYNPLYSMEPVQGFSPGKDLHEWHYRLDIVRTSFQLDLQQAQHPIQSETARTKLVLAGFEHFNDRRQPAHSTICTSVTLNITFQTFVDSVGRNSINTRQPSYLAVTYSKPSDTERFPALLICIPDTRICYLHVKFTEGASLHQRHVARGRSEVIIHSVLADLSSSFQLADRLERIPFPELWDSPGTHFMGFLDVLTRPSSLKGTAQVIAPDHHQLNQSAVNLALIADALQLPGSQMTAEQTKVTESLFWRLVIVRDRGGFLPSMLQGMPGASKTTICLALMLLVTLHTDMVVAYHSSARKVALSACDRFNMALARLIQLDSVRKRDCGGLFIGVPEDERACINSVTRIMPTHERSDALQQLWSRTAAKFCTLGTLKGWLGRWLEANPTAATQINMVILEEASQMWIGEAIGVQMYPQLSALLTCGDQHQLGPFVGRIQRATWSTMSLMSRLEGSATAFQLTECLRSIDPPQDLTILARLVYGVQEVPPSPSPPEQSGACIALRRLFTDPLRFGKLQTEDVVNEAVVFVDVQSDEDRRYITHGIAEVVRRDKLAGKPASMILTHSYAARSDLCHTIASDISTKGVPCISGTIDSIQGESASAVVVLLDPPGGRPDSIGFLNDYRRVIVTMTRARYFTVVLASHEWLEKSTQLGEPQTFVTLEPTQMLPNISQVVPNPPLMAAYWDRAKAFKRALYTSEIVPIIKEVLSAHRHVGARPMDQTSAQADAPTTFEINPNNALRWPRVVSYRSLRNHL